MKSNTQSPEALLMSVGRMIRGKMGKTLPLPFSQCEVLRFVAEKETPTMRDVATRFAISAPSATALVEFLVDKGLLKRHTGKDRRQIKLSLTPKGRSAHAVIQKKREKVIARVLSVLPKKDIADLKRILISIINQS